jgi:regulator of RNase E activity RraA
VTAEPPPSAVVCDALESLGHEPRVLAPAVRPLAAEWALAAPAFVVELTPARLDREESHEQLVAAYGSIPAGAVAVLAADGVAAALWGEFLSRMAQEAGVAGLVTSGYVRDAAAIQELGFRAFSRGTSPLSPDGRVAVSSVGGAAEVAGVRVESGELVVADVDGVVLVPAAVQAETLQVVATLLAEEARARAAG